MLTYPHIDPVALQIGPIKIHWYGLMYLIGFGAAYVLGTYRAKREHWSFTPDELTDCIFYCAMGVIIGGRMGYMLIYAFPMLVNDPISLFKLWQGGMSFHGGLLGVATAMWLYARKTQRPLLQLSDFLAPMVPIGLGAGRIGNFINGELYGRITDVPWAMVFPGAGPLPRHPSELYEFALEGVVLFVLLWWYSSKPRPQGAVSGWFLVGYGTFRAFAEFFRAPDPQLSFIAFDWLTMGQLLSLPMIVGGAVLVWWSVGRGASAGHNAQKGSSLQSS